MNTYYHSLINSTSHIHHHILAQTSGMFFIKLLIWGRVFQPRFELIWHWIKGAALHWTTFFCSIFSQVGRAKPHVTKTEEKASTLWTSYHKRELEAAQIIWPQTFFSFLYVLTPAVCIYTLETSHHYKAAGSESLEEWTGKDMKR